jgi:hypothetical protein
MRTFQQLATVVTVAGLTLVPLAGVSGAATDVGLRGGTTSVTTGPGIALALLTNGIVPLATAPGRESARPGSKGPAVVFSFPVTGGRVTLKPLGGTVDHQGGIAFYDVRTGKSITVGRFVIQLRSAELTGIVNGNPKARVPLFHLSLAHAKLTACKHGVVARGIGVTLIATAVNVLDATLGTTLFTPGLSLGTATTTLAF